MTLARALTTFDRLSGKIPLPVEVRVATKKKKQKRRAKGLSLEPRLRLAPAADESGESEKLSDTASSTKWNETRLLRWRLRALPLVTLPSLCYLQLTLAKTASRDLATGGVPASFRWLFLTVCYRHV